MILHYAKTTEENGVIVALNQEKAYDKIAHDYLWLTLDKYELPPSFVNIVKSLYESAETLVVINGKKSSTFKVTRGVRQVVFKSPVARPAKNQQLDQTENGCN